MSEQHEVDQAVRSRSRRRAGRRASLLGLAAVCGVLGIGAVPVSAAVPTFPDNVVVFPDRDFVTIEGYQDRVGQTATVTVTRGTQVVGSAVSTVAAGDVVTYGRCPAA